MSKTPYTVSVDTTICSELEAMRKCHKNRDYSMLMALVERVQYHANQMEEALWGYKRLKEIIEGSDYLSAGDDPVRTLTQLKEQMAKLDKGEKAWEKQ